MRRASTNTARGPRRSLSGDFRRTRKENALEVARDYVEMIDDLIATRGAARVTELARRLGVTHVTVIRTIQRLKRDGLVTALPHRSVFLTEAGRKLSEKSRHCHEVVMEFLKALGVPDRVARADAEGIEHHVSEETLEAFALHLRRQHKSPRAASKR